MTTQEMISGGMLLCAIVAAICAILAARRAGKWRDSDAAQSLLAKVTRIEQTQALHAQRLTHLESEIADLPTKADFERLNGTVNQTCAIADRTEQSVIRLQQFLMDKAGA